MKTRLFNFEKFSTSTLLLMCEHDIYHWYLGSAYAENVHLFLNAS